MCPHVTDSNCRLCLCVYANAAAYLLVKLSCNVPFLTHIYNPQLLNSCLPLLLPHLFFPSSAGRCLSAGTDEVMERRDAQWLPNNWLHLWVQTHEIKQENRKEKENDKRLGERWKGKCVRGEGIMGKAAERETQLTQGKKWRLMGMTDKEHHQGQFQH